MFRLYNQNKQACAPIINYYDVSIQEEINTLKTIDFSVRGEVPNLVTEGYLETEYGNFVIKEIDRDNDDTIKVHAIQNAEELQGAKLLKAEYEEQTIQSAFNILFGKSTGADGWTAKFNFPSGNRLTTAKRSNQFYKTSLWEALQDIREQYFAEYKYDEINKVIQVYDAAERRLNSSNKGIILMRDLNLADISVAQDTNDFITVIYPYGKEVKDGIRLNISDVKGDDTYYLSNYTYSNKRIREYWIDDNYEPRLITDNLEATKDDQETFTLSETPKTKSWIISVECKIKTTKNKKTTWTDKDVKSSYYSLSGKKLTITNETLKKKITKGSKLKVKYYINYGSRAEDLMADAQIRLKELSTPAISFSITAADLSKLRGGFTSYDLGDILTLRDNSDVKMRIVGKKWNPQNPEEVELTLNSRRKTLDEAQARRKRFVNKLKNNTSNSGSSTSASKNSVSSSSIQAGSVGSDQIINGSIMSLHIGEGEIDSANIKEAAIDTAHITDAAITTAKIGDAQITSALIEDAAITNAKIGLAAIEKANIAEAAIGTAHIERGAITTALIANGAVQSEQVADASITDAKIVGLTANKITAGTIDAADIEVINLNAANLTVGTINGTQIASGTIELGNLSQTVIDAMGSGGGMKTYFQAEAPTSANEGDLWFDIDDGNKLYSYQNGDWTAYKFGASALSANCITSEHLASGAITTGKIAAGAVTADTIAANAITTDKLAAGAITSDALATGAVTADKIVAKAITAEKIATATITANQIAANTITSAEINTTQLFSQYISATNMNISGGSVNITTSSDTGNLIQLTGSYSNIKIAPALLQMSKYNNKAQLDYRGLKIIDSDMGKSIFLNTDSYLTLAGDYAGIAINGSGASIKINGTSLDYLYSALGHNHSGTTLNPSGITSMGIYNDTVSYATNMYIGTSGIMHRTTNTSTRAVKDDIMPVQDEMLNPQRLYDAEVVQFKYKENILPPTDMRYRQNLIGFIVDDLEEVYPIAVDKEDGVAFQWNEQYLIPAMLKLIQEQKEEIEAIKAQIGEQE